MSQYHLHDTGIGLALAGSGLPGIFFGTVIGKWGDRYGRSYVRPCRLFVGCTMCILPASPRSALCRCACHHTLSAGFDATRPLMSSPPAGFEAPSSRRMGETGAGPGIPGRWLNESGSGHAHRVNRVRKSSATKSKRKSSFGSIRDSPTQIWCARKQNRYRLTGRLILYLCLALGLRLSYRGPEGGGATRCAGCFAGLRSNDTSCSSAASTRSLQRHKLEPGSVCQRMLINTL
jgi:hypothetical protein